VTHPLPPRRCPGSAAFWRALTVVQEVLGQWVLGSRLVLLGRFADRNQIAQGFVLGIGTPNGIGCRSRLGGVLDFYHREAA